jgi:hypothetical protein
MKFIRIEIKESVPVAVFKMEKYASPEYFVFKLDEFKGLKIDNETLKAYKALVEYNDNLKKVFE